MYSMNLHRRTLLQAGTLVLLLGRAQLARGASILGVRVWPANDYTRVTIESDTALVTRYTMVGQPPRLAVDIEGIELNAELRELVGKVRSDDPFITGVRIGQFTPTTVRLVMDLRQPVKPQVFNLEPVQAAQASFQHRLVLDLYPLNAMDPLEALIAEKLKDEHKLPPARDALDELIASHTTDVTTKPVQSSSTVTSALPSVNPPQTVTAQPVPTTPAAPAPTVAAQSNNKPASSPIAPVLPNNPPANSAASSTPTPAPVNTPTNDPRPVARTPDNEQVFDRFAVVALDPGHGGDAIGGLNIKVQDQHVQRALFDMSTTAQINDSLKLGVEMLSQIRRVGKLHKPQVEQAGFAVLKAPDIPSLLVETAFISNPQEEALLLSETYQNQLADALLAGIENYFLRNPPMARNRSM